MIVVIYIASPSAKQFSLTNDVLVNKENLEWIFVLLSTIFRMCMRTYRISAVKKSNILKNFQPQVSYFNISINFNILLKMFFEIYQQAKCFSLSIWFSWIIYLHNDIEDSNKFKSVKFICSVFVNYTLCLTFLYLFYHKNN